MGEMKENRRNIFWEQNGQVFDGKHMDSTPMSQTSQRLDAAAALVTLIRKLLDVLPIWKSLLGLFKTVAVSVHLSYWGESYCVEAPPKKGPLSPCEKTHAISCTVLYRLPQFAMRRKET